MLSRRGFLTAIAASGLAGTIRPGNSVETPPSIEPVRFDVPERACDCHVHIFGDANRFPFAASRTYTPESASITQLLALDRALYFSRVVIVQPSVYGTDNSCTLDSIKQYGPGARGIAVLPTETPSTTLDSMETAGIRGVRINLGTAGDTNLDNARHRLKSAIERIQGRKWHVQVYAALPVIAGLSDIVLASPVPVVFDHFGGAKAALGVEQSGFDKLLQLVRSGKGYVKISGAYRASDRPPDYPDVAPLAHALIEANPHRVLWGSDWPHPDTGAGRKPSDVSPLLRMDDGHLLNLITTWAPDASLRKTILVDNPATLYGFSATSGL
jgi:predicted TIM-barrel fold metal-dependent hydrolase